MERTTHAHDCSEHECATGFSLHKYVDLTKVWALNEAVEGSAKSVLKSWEQRLEISAEQEHLRSNDDDPELLLFIPFTSDVVIKGICVIGGGGGTSPAKMRAFINRKDIDFSNVQELSPVQEWELVENTHGDVEYQTRFARFQGVASLTLHFPQTFGSTETEIFYVGMRGEGTGSKRDAAVTTVYETTANPTEHKVPLDDLSPQILPY